jgi:hypothetical protein
MIVWGIWNMMLMLMIGLGLWCLMPLIAIKIIVWFSFHWDNNCTSTFWSNPRHESDPIELTEIEIIPH